MKQLKQKTIISLRNPTLWLTLLTLIILLTASSVRAADGDLDLSFDGDGKVVASQNSATFFEVLEDIAVQSDGKIVAVGTQNNIVDGNQQFVIFRLNADGSFDSSFGTGGMATIKPSANATNDAQCVVIQPDGKILLGGTGAGSFLLARLNANGSPDTTFDADGKLEITGLSFLGALALEAQTGKIYAGGGGILFTPSVRGAFTVYRLNPNGSLDTTFGTGGRVQTGVGVAEFGNGNVVDGLAIQTDGKIVVVGESLTTSAHTDFTVLRYNTNGSLDTSFDADGIVVTTFGNRRSRALEVALQADGKIVAVGDQDQTNTIDDLTVVRYNTNGSLDSSFGNGGKAVQLGAAANESDLAIQADGKIVFVGEQLANGSETRIFVGRLTANGVLDSTFSGDGSTTTAIGVTDVAKAVALQSDGKIVVGAVTTAANQSTNQRKFGIVRYLNSAVTVPADNPALRVADFDGDKRTDASIFRSGTWFIKPSGNSNFTDAPNADYAVQFGQSGDKLVPADFDGDGKTDIAVWREGSFSYFYIIQSADNTFRAEQFGTTGDNPIVAGNWDADNKADLAVYRNANGSDGQNYFYYRPSAQAGVNFISVQWGTGGDEAIRGDFDGDGKLDAAVYRATDNVWYIRQSKNSQIRAERWGAPTDMRISGDFDGDGKSDLAIYRDGLWAVLQSSNGTQLYRQWGAAADKVAAGDYDGDGKTDFAVWRNGLYYILNNTSGQSSVLQFGTTGDVPVASAFVQ